jgi:hypothetical protein
MQIATVVRTMSLNITKQMLPVIFVVKYYHYTVHVFHRRRKSGKRDFIVSANMTYGQVKLEALGDSVGGEYDDPDKLARSGRGRGGGGNYEPTGYPASYEFPASKLVTS